MDGAGSLWDDGPGRGREREHRFPGRHHRVNLRFGLEELREVQTAAAAVGKTTAGYCAEAALATARGSTVGGDPWRETLARVQSDLFALRVVVADIDAGLRERAKMLGADKFSAVPSEDASRALAGIDALTSRIHRMLR